MEVDEDGKWMSVCKERYLLENWRAIFEYINNN